MINKLNKFINYANINETKNEFYKFLTNKLCKNKKK